MLTELCHLCIKYGTDKGPRVMNGWGYSPRYHDAFKEMRHAVRKVLEIGICGHRDIPNNVIGASLFVWRDYFPHAEIYGIDNDPRWMVNGEDRIHTFCFDAYQAEPMAKFVEEHGGFDFICDDAVHDPIAQLVLLHNLWSALNPGGVYAMEDVCPYKLPHGNLDHLVRFFPSTNDTVEVIATHKDERLLLIR